MLYTVHAWSFHPSLSPLVYKIRVLSEKFLTKKAHTTICVSYVNQQEGKQLFQLANSQVIVNGVNTEKFNIAMENLRQQRNKLLADTDYLALSDNTMTEEINRMIFTNGFLTCYDWDNI